MLEAAIDLLAEIRNDGPNVVALCHKIRLMAGPNDDVTLGDARNMKQGVHKGTIVQALQNTGSTDADIVYEDSIGSPGSGVTRVSRSTVSSRR